MQYIGFGDIALGQCGFAVAQRMHALFGVFTQRINRGDVARRQHQRKTDKKHRCDRPHHTGVQRAVSSFAGGILAEQAAQQKRRCKRTECLADKPDEHPYKAINGNRTASAAARTQPRYERAQHCQKQCEGDDVACEVCRRQQCRAALMRRIPTRDKAIHPAHTAGKRVAGDKADRQKNKPRHSRPGTVYVLFRTEIIPCDAAQKHRDGTAERQDEKTL